MDNGMVNGKRLSPIRAIPDRLMSVKELAEYLSISERWIRLRISRKEIPYYRLVGAIRFNPEEVIEYMRRRTEAA